MKFTLMQYKEMLELIREKDYKIYKYTDKIDADVNHVILRHDIDMCLEKALEFAKVEYSLGIESTYFILLSSDFYNIYSKKSINILNEIIKYGHDIGLHFDEVRYEVKDQRELENKVYAEVKIINEMLNYDIKSISMHRPSEIFLKSNMKFDNLINTYSREYFSQYKYLSDSRMTCREDILKLIKEKKYTKFHILTHPIWYCEIEKNCKEVLQEMLKNKSKLMFDTLNENFKNLEEILIE